MPLDMGADASVYALGPLAVRGATARKKQRARGSGYLQLGLAIVGLVEVVRRFVVGEALPDTTSMIVDGHDIKVNALVIAAAVLAVTGSALPDLIAGAAIFMIVADGSRRILRISS